MKRAIKIIFLCIIFLSWNVVSAQDQCKPVGWATQNGGVTGGGSATPTVVSTYAALKTALTTKTVKVVHVSGTITFPANGRITLQDTDGKTVIGLAGSKMVSVDKTAGGSGILYIKRTTNLILRNLTFEGPGAYDTDGNDNLTVDNCQNLWVDHCDFQDGMDGNFDIKNASDFITVTWCKFSYLKPPIAGGSGGSNDHRYTNLIGSSDGATGDAGKLRITFQYCWWAQGCVERMPRVRYGKIHLANNFFNSTVSNSCIRAGYKADLLIENNVFIGVKNPIDLFNNDFTAVTERNNIFTNTSGGKSGSKTAFTPPYSITLSNANAVQGLVTNTSCGSGATLDSPTQCGCGTQPTNKNPTATLSAPSNGSNACTGTSITISANAQDSDGTISKVDFYNGTTFLGSDNSSPYSISYTPTVDGTLSIKATATDNSGGTGNSGVNTITVHALPIITQNAQINTGVWSATATATVCPTGTLALGPWPTQTGTWKWTGPNNFNSTVRDPILTNLVAANAGTYTTTYTDATGCKATSTFKLNIAALPTATVSSSTTNLCSTGSIVLSTGSGDSYIWFKDNKQVGTDETFTATEAGAYTVEITNAADCKATSAARILTLTPQAIPVITAPTTSICVGNSVVLSTNTEAAYKWFKGTTQVGTAATLPVTEGGAYTVEVTNNSGCKAVSTVKQINVTSATKWYADTDNDGKGDAATTLLSCTQPQGYVAVAGDACPTDANKTATGNCGCGNTEASCLDCAGIPNGTAVFDNCNICVGGTTGNTACITTATTNGTTSNITVVPQPFDVNTSISIANLGMIQSITIINTAGSIVETKQHINTESITLGESLASGLYTVIIQSEQGVYTTKIVKK